MFSQSLKIIIWSSLIIVHHKSFIHEGICLKLIFTRSVFSHALLHIQTDLFHWYLVRRCSIHQEKYFPFLELVHNQVCWCNHLVTVRYIQDVVKLIKLIPSCRSGYRQKDGKPDQPWNQLPIPTTAHMHLWQPVRVYQQWKVTKTNGCHYKGQIKLLSDSVHHLILHLILDFKSVIHVVTQDRENKAKTMKH